MTGKKTFYMIYDMTDGIFILNRTFMNVEAAKAYVRMNMEDEFEGSDNLVIFEMKPVALGRRQGFGWAAPDDFSLSEMHHDENTGAP